MSTAASAVDNQGLLEHHNEGSTTAVRLGDSGSPLSKSWNYLGMLLSS